MKYYGLDPLKYPGDKSIWRFNDDGSVDYRDEPGEEFRKALVLTDESKLEDRFWQADLIRYDHDPWEYLCNDSGSTELSI